MSMFDAPGKDVAGGVEPTAGAARGFVETVSDAYDASWRAMSQFGVDTELERLNAAQSQKVFERTGKREGHLRLPGEGDLVASFGGVGGLAAFYERGGTPEQADALSKHDGGIETLRKTYPDLDLKTSREMWETVKSAAVEAERKAAGPGSTVGHFLGEAAAGLDPRVNPLNTMSLGVAGFGPTIARRVATEAGGQAIVQAVNELTGVNENRRLLGLETGFGQSAGRVGQAAVVGGALRAAGEGLGRLFRRGAPTPSADPATPPQSAAVRAGVAVPEDGSLFRDFADFETQLARPKGEQLIAEAVAHTTQQNIYGRSRLAVARHEGDILSMERQLQDFRREGPARLGGDTARLDTPTTAEVTVPHWMRNAEERVPVIAREVDPELYAQLDKLDRRIADKRASLADIRAERADNPTEALDAALAKADELEDQIAEMRSQLPEADRRKVKRLNRKITELEDEQRAVLAPHAEAGRYVANADETTAALSKAITELEADRRALGPLKKRAEDIASQRFEDSRAKGETFEFMTDVLRRELRIGEAETQNVLMTRRPSEKATEAEGGSEITPGTLRRPGRTSGPNPNEKPNDGSAIERWIKDLSHENAQGHEVVRATFEAADVLRRIAQLEADIAAKTGTEGAGATIAKLKAERDALANGEVIIGGHRYKLDDEFVGEVIRDENGKAIGLEKKTVREVLREIADDADMLQSMKGCAI